MVDVEELMRVDRVPVEALEEQIRELSAHLNAATCRYLLLLGAFDEARGWERLGMASCAQWEHWRCGVSLSAAHEHLRVARALRQFPLIADAFLRGALTYSKVRAVTRFAGPATEAMLVEWSAWATAAQLERLGRGMRTVKSLEDPARLARRRASHIRYHDDGLVELRVFLPPDAATVVLRAVAAAEADAAKDDPVSGQEASHSSAEDCDHHDIDQCIEASPLHLRRSADAFVRLATSYLAGGTAESTPRPLLIVHERQSSAEEPVYELENGSIISIATAERLLCDPDVIRRVDDDFGRALSIGRSSRRIPRGMRRALAQRDHHCRFPGCQNRGGVHAHHMTHWSRGGDTALTNLVTLCSRHHHLIHEGGYGSEVKGGRIIFRTPSGRILDSQPFIIPVGDATLIDANEKFKIAADTGMTQWAGSPPDYGLAVHVLLEQEVG